MFNRVVRALGALCIAVGLCALAYGLHSIIAASWSLEAQLVVYGIATAIIGFMVWGSADKKVQLEDWNRR